MATKTVFKQLSLGKDFVLEANAADAYEKLATEFKKQFGKTLTITPGGAYRSVAAQTRVFLDRYRVQWVGSGPFGDVRWWQGRRYVRYRLAAAAIPGTSNHGRGNAADFSARVNVGNSAEHQWVVAHGPRFGWQWPTWARSRPSYEPWHHESDMKPRMISTKNVKEYTTLKLKLRTVQRGSEGGAVKQLQGLLVAHGYSLVIDGVFGAATQAAIIAFQRGHGLVTDGIVGKRTWARLLAQ